MSELLSTDVLAVLSLGEYIFVGIGYSLRTYEKSTNTLVSKLDVCYPDKIHGIVKGPGDFLAVFGGKNISIVELNISDDTIRTTLFDDVHRFNDWIIAVGWWSDKGDDSRLAILSAHNRLSLYNWRNKETEGFQCEEKCILYGGSVVKDSSNNYVVFAGTVFQEIVLWAVTDSTKKDEVPVLHRLRGHNGVIFSVTFDPVTRLICSTSDDRTIRLWSVEAHPPDDNHIKKWKNATISLVTTMFGHTARVWRALIRRNFVISVGEDSLVCVWTTKGELLRKTEAHHGAPIWSVDVSVDDDVIITGGGDGAVHRWPLSRDESFTTEYIPIENSLDVPKHIGFLRSETMIAVTQRGRIITQNAKLGTEKKSFDNKIYSSYAIMQISPNRKRAALASLDGHLTVYEEDKRTGCLQTVLEVKIMASKILSMHWLNDESLLLCGFEGCLKTVKIANGEAVVESEHILPRSRERWTTAAIIHESLLICGDRAGSIHLYRTSDINEANDINLSPFQSLLKIHGRLGVHSCTIVENQLLTTGRDGTLRFYELRKIEDSQTISPLNVDKMPMEWVSTVLKTRTDLYVLGFKEVDFVLYSTSHQRVLLRIHCGGGHRSWDYMLNNGIFSLAYIRDKQIHSVNCELDSLALPAIQNGFHSKEVYSVQRIPTTTGHNVIISGGEDRNLRVTHITELKSPQSRQFETIALLSGHISSIRTISLINLKDTATRSENLIFSGGGRAQVKVWRVGMNFDEHGFDKKNLSCVELASHMLRGTDRHQRNLQQKIQASHYVDPETRYMNINAYRIPTNPNLVLLLVACSDGFLRIFIYNISKCSIHLRSAIPYNNRCLIKTHLFNWDGNMIALTMATDGVVNFWHLNDAVDAISEEDLSEHDDQVLPTDISPFSRLSLHQCGINSYDLIQLDRSEFMLATGGDDNLICLTVFEIESENEGMSIKEITKWNCASAHSTQITGLILDARGSLISVGIDQKVLTFDYLYEHGFLTVSPRDEIITSIPDVQGMISCHTSESDNVLLCVYGKGFEMIRRKLQSLDVK